MFTALTLLAAAIGVILLATYPLAGVALLLAVAWPLFKRAGVRDEEAFMALLMVAAGAGALSEFAAYLLQRL